MRWCHAGLGVRVGSTHRGGVTMTCPSTSVTSQLPAWTAVWWPGQSET